ncbi:MAG: group 1 truncated hemoglobin [Flavobacteriales bacterium]|nr:MAG: group 1 truncated hemoglobin [Flavobacteriales bacterium]
MNTKLSTALLSALCCGMLLSGCKKDEEEPPAPNPSPTPTIYQRLGGTALVDDPANTGTMIETGYLGLRSVVDSTIFVIAADPGLQPYFAVLLAEVGGGNTTNLAILSENLTEFFAVATGAQNFSYTGMNMVDAHNPATNNRMTGLVTDGAYDEFIQDLVIGAAQNNVPSDIVTDIGALVETLRGDIVQM